jgi:DNA-binding SARP family transcriptional activator
MVAQVPQSGDAIMLSLVGEFRVALAGSTLSAPEIGSRKARTLLKLLAVGQGGWMHADQIVDVLWPAEAPQRPTEGVATLVSRLRAALGDSIIDGDRDGYRLGQPPNVDVDLAAAERHVVEARRRSTTGDTGLASGSAMRALAILGDGRVLVADAGADWAESARTLAVELLREARSLAAAAALAIGEPAAARDIARAAVAADGFDEPAIRLLMRAEATLGEPARALAAFEQLRSVLAGELGVDPAPETRDVHGAILREEVIPSAPTRRKLPFRTALVGRDAAMDLLTKRWSAAARGEAALVLITGEAGIGKTRLAAEVADLAVRTGGELLRSRSYEAERSLFLQPIVDALGEHASTTSPATISAAAGDWAGPIVALVPQIAAILAPLPMQQDRGDIARRRAYDAFARYICRLATTPTLLLIDDLHQAGLATVEFLHYLVRQARIGQAGDARLMIVATVRSEEGAAAIAALSDVGERLELTALTAAAVGQLAQAAGHADAADRIVARTRGHTLFVVETLRSLDGDDPGIPSSLQAAVLARVGRTGERCEKLLRAAAVLGPAIEPETIARLLDISPIVATETCEQALAARLLVVTDRAYEFANDLIREVVYASMPRPTLVAYHRRAADLLSDRPEAVGAHATAAGDWARAGRAWLVAGEQAAARFAFADAVVLLGRAIDASDRSHAPEVAGRAYLVRGRARDAITAYADSMDDYTAAAALARESGDQRLEMMTLRELSGDVQVALGMPVTQCIPDLEAGIQIAEALGDRAVEADMLARLAVIACNRLRFTEALSYGHRAVAAARASIDDYALAMALDGLKTPYAYLGEITALAPILTELEPLLRQQGDLWRLPWAVQEGAFSALAAGEWSAALDRLQDAREINHASGYRAYEGWFVGQIGWAHRLAGDLDKALVFGREAIDLTRHSTHTWWRSAACSQLAGTLLATGDTAAAIELLETGRRLASRDGSEAYLLNCLALLAETTGDRQILDEADALLRGIEVPPGCAWILGAEAYLAVGRSWQRAGDPERAGDTVTPLHAAAERIGWLWVRDAAARIMSGQ